ncbi:MAG: MFS transporter, partial [Thermoleophilia bacterium]|nr:MFS transporter [Thermoleophilia bacterium]
ATFGCVPTFVMLGIGAPLWLLAAAAFVTGASVAVFEVQWSTALQVHIPEQALSRVSSYDYLGSFMLGPLGMIAVGPVANQIGFEATLIGGAMLMALMTSLTLLSPSVRNLPAGPAPK